MEVLIPFAGEFLALAPEQLAQALQRGREIMPKTAPSPSTGALPDEILDAEGMAAKTNIPASWWLEQARQEAIPHIRAGKYVRFKFSEVLVSLKRRSSTDLRTDGKLELAARSAPYKRHTRVATSSGSRLAGKPATV